MNEIKTFDTISQRSISEKSNFLVVPATELFQIQQSDILNLSSHKKENLDDYELFQYSQNLDVEKCLLDLTNNVAIHIVDKNIVDNQLKEIIDIEKDTFENLKQYFSLEIRNFKSRYKDISKYFGENDINFYSTSDLINLENLPNYFDSNNTENIIDSLREIEKIYLSTKNKVITEKFSMLSNVITVDNPFSFSASFKLSLIHI